MAIAFDSSTGGDYVAGSTSLTFSHTCSGDDRALFVSILTNTDADTVTGVTYDGDSMTRVDAFLGKNYYHYVYELANPSSGSNNVVISTDTSLNIFGCATSYTGVDQTNPSEANNKGETDSGTSLGVSVTTSTDNAWVYGGTFCGSKPTEMSAGAGTTAREIGGSMEYTGSVDSGDVISPAGSKTLNISSSDAQPLGMIVVAITPTGGGGASHTKGLSETMSISESLSAISAFKRSIADSFAFSDSILTKLPPIIRHFLRID